MVKFTKEFEAQLVPEWKHAFVDYWQLKKDLKKIRLLHTNNNTNNVINNVSPHKKENTTFSTTLLSSLRKISPFGPKQRNHSPIHVHRRLASSAIKGDQYETELVQQFEGVEAAREFFALLDVQLNKVNHFYKTKENEFLERGDSVKKQMEILLELKAALRRGAQSDDTSITCHIPSEDLTESAEEPDEEQSMNNETKRSRSILMEDSSTKGLSGQVFNCQGKNIKLNIPHTASSRTLSALSCLVSESLVTKSSKKYIPRRTNLHANKTKLHQAEKIIRGAFIELYKGLGYIKTYRNLNTLAFVKILKKFDKVTQKEVMPIYLRVVESSYFNSSDSVMTLADEIEELFVKHFTENDHKKAMKYLKPNQRKESHAITFFIGLFTGCFIALLAGYVIMARIAGMYTQASDTIYMETVYPVLSMFSLLFLHFFLYGCNIYLWKKARINYSFIFDLAPSKELNYKRVFLICSTSMTVIIGVLFIHLSLIAKGYNSTQAQAIPSILLLCFLLLVICPFNIVYKSSRYRFLRVIRNIALSPLYTVSMFDFFMADQLCSQVPLLRNLEYLACYYITGSYKTQDYGYCMTTTHYRDLAYAVSLLPYYWRAMQCARRWFDEGETSHLANLGKYVSAMLAAGAKVAYEKKNSVGYLCLVVAMSSAATVYQLYWDYVKDWGLLQCDSKNPWLRNELMVRRKFIYYFSMVLNFVLRLAWLQTVLHPNFGNVDYRVMGLFLAALEVIRRGQWNFYRLENEHLNNTGKFREVKTVPLPFREVDGQD